MRCREKIGIQRKKFSQILHFSYGTGGGADLEEPQGLVNMFRRMEEGTAGNSLSQQI
jgi:hypothetical protein